MYVHFPHQIGAAREKPELERSAALMAATGTSTFNVHVAPSSERFPELAVGEGRFGSLIPHAVQLILDGWRSPR